MDARAREEALQRRVAHIEEELGRLTAAQQAFTSDLAHLRHELDAERAKETPYAYVTRRTRNIPASIRRRRRERRMRQIVAADRVEVSGAELERQRRIVADFLDQGDLRRPAVATGTGSPAQLTLDTNDEPEVSVIVPVHGATAEVLACLRSFAAHPPKVAFEIIIANDATPEEAFAPIREVGGIRILDQPRNLGFLANCNAAVDEARGRYIWFLNSDTVLRRGSLDALVDTFELFPNVAIAGSKLLFPDGTLQDAGGIVWSDGSAWNYGRGSDPTRPEVNYARHADYVSGASLLVRREVLEELGRFDTAFVPAYYEDTDLCMQARQAGYAVIYQPASEVVHNEGSSHGTDVDDRSSLKHHQRINQETFVRKWRSVLAGHRPNGLEPEREKERSVETRVLVIDARTLSPDQDSGSLRMSNVIRALRSIGAKVTFIPQNLTAHEPEATNLRRSGVEFVAGPHVRDIESFLRTRGAEFDMVVLSRLEVAEAFIGAARMSCPNAVIVYDTVDLHFLRLQRELQLTGRVGTGDDPEQTRRQELSCVVRSDVTFVCSTVEKDLLGRLLPQSPVEVLGNIHDVLPTTSPPAARSGILFVGGFEHPPNIDAMEWFTVEVLPLITEQESDVVLHIVGSKMPARVRELAGPGVIVHGHLPDLGPSYESARLCIAPLRYGAGLKGKVTEALARGVPCVGTSIAVEGSGLVDGEHLLVADDADAFAAATVRLLRDDQLWADLATAGLKYLEATFGPEHAAEVLTRTIQHRPPGRARTV